MERKPRRFEDPVAPKDNGDSPSFVLVDDRGTVRVFGPYNKGFAEHIGEVFAGTVVQCNPFVVSEKMSIKKKRDE